MMGDHMGPEGVRTSSEKINVKVSSGGEIYNDLGLWDQVLNGWGYVSQYGWFILLGLVVLLYVWYKIRPSFQEWQRKQRDLEDERNFDPVKAEQHQDAMLLARERMQKKLDEDAAIYAKKKEEREAQKRDEKIEQWETFKVVGKSKTKVAEKSYDSNYLPLGGGGGRGGGGGYRPARRQVGGGGG